MSLKMVKGVLPKRDSEMSETEEVTKKPSEDPKTIQCPNCKSRVRRGGFARHQKSKKCRCKNVYRSRAEIGKKKVECARCKREVCKNKLARHMRSKRCELAGFAFA